MGKSENDVEKTPVSPEHSPPVSRSGYRPQSGEACARERSGSTCGTPQGTPRGRSIGARARTDTLVQRRLKLFEELSRLNGEVSSLQLELLTALRNCPPLLPAGSAAQRRHVFNVITEFLVEAIADLRNSSLSSSKASMPSELLSWLPGIASNQSSLCDVRVGMLRLGALLDMEALEELLSVQFVPLLQQVCSLVDEVQLCEAVSQSIKSLRAWVAGKC